MAFVVLAAIVVLAGLGAGIVRLARQPPGSFDGLLPDRFLALPGFRPAARARARCPECRGGKLGVSTSEHGPYLRCARCYSAWTMGGLRIHRAGWGRASG